jgi:DNA mismatch repair protein MutL
MAIRLLDNATINRIAAGEVVERPASVVKELVENALDAGATQIWVEIRGGGTALIRVTDNGMGIPQGEAALAFERHATSKIRNAEDLHKIETLGFRGEALPSIASVADIELITSAEGEPSGTLLTLEGGIITAQKSQARTRGTTITAGNLFRRVPARLKFLKTPATETSRAAEVVSQYALAYPEVAFSFTTDGRETLRTSGQGRMLDVIIDVYGAATAAKMLPVDVAAADWHPSTEETAAIRVTGMVGGPELSRSSRDGISLFVNRRWVNSRILTYAVEEAYSGLLMTGRHPIAVLNINIPPEEVDVNIHPAKSEVKFRNDSPVFRAVQKAVRQALTSRMGVPGIEEVAAPYRTDSYQGNSPAPLPPQLQRLLNVTDHLDKKTASEPAEIQPRLEDTLPVLRVVGQVMNVYIVAEGPDGLYLIDQHAAHERIRYDTVLKQHEQCKPEIQGLLEPATLELTPKQDAVLAVSLGELADFGFHIEMFGDRTYLTRAVPAMVAGDDWAAVLREMLDALASETRSSREEKIAASIACHGAIKRGQALSEVEMKSLVRQLEETANPHSCPHGRPTVIRLSAAQLGREFGRT